MNPFQRDKLKEKKSQSREMDSLDSTYLEKKTLRHPFQDRYDDQRSGKWDHDERLKNPKFTGYFHGQANLNAGKVAEHYYNTLMQINASNTTYLPSITCAYNMEAPYALLLSI